MAEPEMNIELHELLVDIQISAQESWDRYANAYNRWFELDMEEKLKLIKEEIEKRLS